MTKLDFVSIWVRGNLAKRYVIIIIINVFNVFNVNVTFQISVEKCDGSDRQIWMFDYYEEGKESWRPDV